MYDKVFTVGCFDQFHKGHIKLIKTMKKYGKEIIVGLHDDKSIEYLKNLNNFHHDSLDKRLDNLKKHVDRVFIVSDKDPTIYLKAIINKNDISKSCYIRANDMPNFPGRKFIEDEGIKIILIPYTKGISATQIRKKKFGL